LSFQTNLPSDRSNAATADFCCLHFKLSIGYTVVLASALKQFDFKRRLVLLYTTELEKQNFKPFLLKKILSWQVLNRLNCVFK
jgi:hypothetical protein